MKTGRILTGQEGLVKALSPPLRPYAEDFTREAVEQSICVFTVQHGAGLPVGQWGEDVPARFTVDSCHQLKESGRPDQANRTGDATTHRSGDVHRRNLPVRTFRDGAVSTARPLANLHVPGSEGLLSVGTKFITVRVPQISDKFTIFTQVGCTFGRFSAGFNACLVPGLYIFCTA